MMIAPLVLLLAAAAPAPAAPTIPLDEDMAARVRTLLGAIDTPVPDDRWRTLGAAAVPHLAGIAQDASVLPSRRARAVRGLTAIDGADARATVLTLARDPAGPFPVRAAAMEGAGRLLDATQLSSELGPVLQSANAVHVRAAAASVLARHGGPSGCALVRDQVGREQGGDVAAFQRATAACGGTP